ncbi:hypothetical protein Lste_2042 [Legionella steelei]|uniref:MORN repeat protein n=1 Tax=Legionella steelei TaxID=947033 RepID=A0A0W0ZIV8_9GAMM|nr:hypothetical protein [Legionella steelei]KTD68884.1 hypothetical protein Lste_2042 [Legionella steelei]
MKKIIVVLMCLVCFCSFAFDHTYDVSGEDENGTELEGTIYSYNGEREVSGELTDENGNNFDFSGQWDSYGHMSGETEEGISVELDVN